MQAASKLNDVPHHGVQVERRHSRSDSAKRGQTLNQVRSALGFREQSADDLPKLRRQSGSLDKERVTGNVCQWSFEFVCYFRHDPTNGRHLLEAGRTLPQVCLIADVRCENYLVALIGQRKRLNLKDPAPRHLDLSLRFSRHGGNALEHVRKAGITENNSSSTIRYRHR